MFNVNITQNGSNLFGITANRTYNIKNISADLEYDTTRASTCGCGAAWHPPAPNILNKWRFCEP